MRDTIHAGELLAVLGRDPKLTRWQLWDQIKHNEDRSSGDYARWQSRLAEHIARGIADDHGLTIDGVATPDPDNCITSPKAWRLKAHEITFGRPAVLIVNQKNSQAMRDWCLPDRMSEKEEVRLEAVATAHNVDVVMLGTLVDGYTGQLYHRQASAERRAEHKASIAAFLEPVRQDIEPDFEIVADRAALRDGRVETARAELSQDIMRSLVEERDNLTSKKVELEIGLKPVVERIDQIDTLLIAGAAEKPVDIGTHIISIETNKAGRKSVKIENKGKILLF